MQWFSFLFISFSITFIHINNASPVKNGEVFRIETLVKLIPADKTDVVKKVDIPDLLSDAKAAWQLFKSVYSRAFEGMEEEETRFLRFLKNFLNIHEHNQLYKQGKKSYRTAINKFADWSEEEIKSLNGFKSQQMNEFTVSSYLSPMTNLSLPTTVDWRKKGYVTAVKDQGRCGSCWSFSTTGSLEGQHYRKTGRLIELSEQQLVDCDMQDHGCQGGIMSAAFDYIRVSGGLELEAKYPYVSGQTQRKESSCRFHKSLAAAQVTGAVRLRQGDEEALKEAVATMGPVSVAIDVTDSFMRYSGGVYASRECTQTELNHAVLVVGYGVENGVPYWLVKNSWGPNWGENGYIKMRRNYSNMCGIATFGIYPLV